MTRDRKPSRTVVKEAERMGIWTCSGGHCIASASGLLAKLGARTGGR